MSIIYDALKKVEEKVDLQGSAAADVKISQKEKPDLKKLMVYFLVLVSGLVAAHFIFSALSYRPAAKDPAKAKLSNNLPAKHVPDPAATLVVPAGVEPAASVAQPAAEPQELEVKEEALPEMTLNGVFYSEGGGYALINNKIVKEGGSVQGVKLVKIYQDFVEMDYNGVKFKLTSLGR